MKPSEELMLLLELNQFFVTRFKLKKQLEYEKSKNTALFHYDNYEDLVLHQYVSQDYHIDLHKNPLIDRTHWGTKIKRFNEFYINHPELKEEITLQIFLSSDTLNEIDKKRILHDILNQWVDEYQKASAEKMNDLKILASFLPATNKKYKSPNKVKLLIVGILFTAMIALYIQGMKGLLEDIAIYRYLGIFVIFLLVIYVVSHSLIASYIHNIKIDKKAYAVKTINQWEEKMAKYKQKQEKLTGKFTSVILKNPEIECLSIKKLIGPETPIRNLTSYVKKMEHKFDLMTKNHQTINKAIGILFIITLIGCIVFFMMGFAMIEGWMNLA